MKNSTKYYTVKSAAREVDKRWKHFKRAAGMEDCPVCKQLLQRGPKKKMQRSRPKAGVSDQPADASFAASTEASPSTKQSTPKRHTLDGSPAPECNVMPIMSSANDACRPRPSTSSVRTLVVSCATSPMLPPRRTLEDTLLKSVDLPPDKMEEQLYYYGYVSTFNAIVLIIVLKQIEIQ